MSQISTESGAESPEPPPESTFKKYGYPLVIAVVTTVASGVTAILVTHFVTIVGVGLGLAAVLSAIFYRRRIAELIRAIHESEKSERTGVPGRRASRWSPVRHWRERRAGRSVGLSRRVLRFLQICLIGGVSTLVGAASVWASVSLPKVVWPPECPAALELYVIVPPETVAAFRRQADGFTRSAVVDGCASTVIKVGPAPSIDDIVSGLRNDWNRDDSRQSDEPFRRRLGPQPAAWIATSSGEVSLVDASVPGGGTAIASEGSVATDRLVVAMAARRIGAFQSLVTEDSSLETQVAVIRSKLKMSVAYPHPEFSTAGLIAVASLRDVQGAVIPGYEEISADNADALVCALMARPSRVDSIALVVPSHVVRDDTGTPCLRQVSGSASLKPISSIDLAGLDYPFVRIGWQGEEDAKRRQALIAFRDWLLEHPPFEPSSSAASYKGAQNLYQARKDFRQKLPQLSAQLAVDVSGPTNDPALALLTQLGEAFPTVQRAVIPSDLIALGEFATEDGRTMVTTTGNLDVDDLLEKVRKITPTGSDAPVSDLLQQLGPRIKPPRRPVVVITDGRLFNDEPDGAALEKALDRADTISALYVLVLGDMTCEDRFPAGGRSPGGKRMVCAEAPSGMSEALKDMLGTVRKWS